MRGMEGRKREGEKWSFYRHTQSPLTVTWYIGILAVGRVRDPGSLPCGFGFLVCFFKAV